LPQAVPSGPQRPPGGRRDHRQGRGSIRRGADRHRQGAPARALRSRSGRPPRLGAEGVSESQEQRRRAGRAPHGGFVVKDQELPLPRLSFGRWGLVVMGAAYLIGLILVANAAFGTSTFFNRQANAPARTGGYDTRIPMVAAVNPDTIAKSITEATGGSPTIGLPLPVEVVVVPKVAATQPLS